MLNLIDKLKGLPLRFNTCFYHISEWSMSYISYFLKRKYFNFFETIFSINNLSDYPHDYILKIKGCVKHV